MSYEIRIDAETKKRARKLANLLLDCGYSVYYADKGLGSAHIVATTLDSSEVTKLSYVKAEVDKDA